MEEPENAILDGLLADEARRTAQMSELRDRFAMAALAGLLGARSLPMGHIEGVAEEAYWFADAMLRAREES